MLDQRQPTSLKKYFLNIIVQLVLCQLLFYEKHAVWPRWRPSRARGPRFIEPSEPPVSTQLWCILSVCLVHLVCTVRRVPPHFSIPPENVEVMPGGSVNLTCVAVGSPMPFVKWRLGALELTPEDNIPIGKNVLMLNDIRESATYTCVAASDLGNIESDAEVRVKGWCFRYYYFSASRTERSLMIGIVLSFVCLSVCL